MVHYCMKVWEGKQIRKDLYWPIYGSLEDWICRQLNIYVNNKRTFNKEENEYAFLWILGMAQTANLFKKRWDTDEPPASPPPYVPPPPPPQGLEQDFPPTAPPDPGKMLLLLIE